MSDTKQNTVAKPIILRRYIAGLIDYGLVFGSDYAYLKTFGESDGNGGYTAHGFLALPPLLLWFLLIIATEQGLGATIGNGIMGLKPVPLFKNHNVKPSFLQSVKRHLADPIDMFLFGLVAVITIKNSPHKQRLGDIWAGTVVVKSDK